MSQKLCQKVNDWPVTIVERSASFRKTEGWSGLPRQDGLYMLKVIKFIFTSVEMKLKGFESPTKN